MKPLLLVSALSLALAVAAPPASATPQDGSRHANRDIPPATERQVANDIQFRRELGLRADPEHVRALYRDAAAGTIEASTAIGAIATPEEQAEVQERSVAVDRAVDVADDYFENRLDVYGGMSIDQARGLVRINVTDDPRAHEQALRTLISPTIVHLTVWRVQYTLDQLLALQRVVDESIEALERQSVDVTSTSIDEEENRVYIAVESDTTHATDVVRNEFPGAPVVVEYEPHPLLNGVSGTNSPPFRGGQNIIGSDQRGPFGECTSAFVGYVVERLDAAIFQYFYKLVTAGHCESKGGVATVGALWTQVTYPVGTSDRNAFGRSSTADALSIPFPSTWKSNEIAISVGDYRHVRCMMTTDVKQGQIELMSGAKSGGYTSGKLVRTNATVRAKDARSGVMITLVRQHMANYTSISGDSGGSVFGTRECSYRAQGVHSSGTDPTSSVRRAYYTPIFSATKALGLSGVETGP